MKLLDLSGDPTLGPLLKLLDVLTRSGSSKEALGAFVARYNQIRPIDHIIGIAPEPAEPGAYRVLYSVRTGASPESRARNGRPLGLAIEDMTPETIRTLPLHTGGFLGEMAQGAEPKLVMELDVSKDDLLAGIVGDLNSCMVLPIFNEGRVQEWTFGFSHRKDGFSARDVVQAQLTANLLGVANRNLDAVHTIKKLNLQLRDQLDQIARVQQSLLPARIPDIPGLEIATSYLTSNESGGDYYDFFRLPGERWGILIADVSGHGAAAATVMAMLHAILHCYPVDDTDFNPAEVLKYANTRLLESGLEGNFVTAFFGVFDTTTGTLVYSNAGHNPPRRKDGLSGEIYAVDGAATLPLGILEPYDSTTETLQLGTNDTLILYTDGITEAFSPQGEMFGTHRLDDALTACSGAPDCIVDSIHTGLFKHRGSATRDDDQTIVAVRFHGLCRI